MKSIINITGIKLFTSILFNFVHPYFYVETLCIAYYLVGVICLQFCKRSCVDNYFDILNGSQKYELMILSLHILF